MNKVPQRPGGSLSHAVLDLVPRLAPSAQELAKRIQALGWDVILEDQIATLATYEWQLRSSDRIRAKTSRRYAISIDCFLTGLGTWPLPGGVDGPVTLFHLTTPGLGLEILHAWRDRFADDDEVCQSVFGESYRAMDRLFKDYLCRPGAIADYGSLARLGRGATRQTAPLLLADRYGPLIDPFPECWRPGRKQRRREPVPRFGEWLLVLDVLSSRQVGWVRTLPERQLFPRLRTVAMLHFHSAAGCRPSELCLVKQGDLLPDGLRILHGGEKDRFPKSQGYDLYGNRRGRYRKVSFDYVPEGLQRRLRAWPKVLTASGRVACQPERALFPNGRGTEENCVSYERYRDNVKSVLLDIADEPAVRAILGPYLVRPAFSEDLWKLRLTPHTIRAIYATHRMDRCDGPGAFRQIMDDLGWLTPSTILQYDRPRRVDPTVVQDQLMTAFQRERAPCNNSNGVSDWPAPSGTSGPLRSCDASWPDGQGSS